MKPLILASMRNHPYDLGLLAQTDYPMDILHVDDFVKADERKVIVGRHCYEHDPHTDMCVKAARVEAAYKERGARIINSVHSCISADRKDWWALYLKTEIPTPTVIPNPTYYEILSMIEGGHLRYPFIYRLADAAGGKGVFLVKNKEELQKAHASIVSKEFGPFCRTMVAQFLEARVDELYWSLRVSVIGSEIERISVSVTDDWIWTPNRTQKAKDVQAEMNKTFELPSFLHRDIRSIRSLFDLDIYTVELIEAPRANYTFIDINPLPFWSLDADAKSDRPGYFERVAKYIYQVQEAS